MVAGLLALVLVLMIAGVAGAFLPLVPGTPLILLGALLYAVATEFHPVDAPRLAVLAALAGVAYALDYVSGALGTKKLGGSRWAIVGALAGGLAGFAFGPLGIILGPILGAILAELVYRKDLQAALRSGVGAVIGIFFGIAAKLSVSVVMVALFAFWVFQG